MKFFTLNTFAALAFTLASLKTWSFEEKFYSNQSMATVVQEAPGLVHLRIFEIDSDGWQSLKKTKRFANLKEARAFAETLGLKKSNKNVFNIQSSAPLESKNEIQLWPATQSWSLEWEQKYSKWIQEEVDENFFVKYNLPTDCADVAYMLRWIFAHNNGLPAANHLAGSGRVFTNLDIPSRFKNLPTNPQWDKDKRFRAALDYLMDNTYTHALMQDSYPVALNSDGIAPGTYFLEVRKVSGHTQFLFKRSDDNSELPFMMISSTVPRSVRTLQKHFLWAAKPQVGTNSLVRMRWASGRTLLAPEASPLYSKEQFEIELKDDFSFPRFLIDRLRPNFSFDAAIQSGLKDIVTMLNDRKRIVEEGYAYCKSNPASCKEGTQGWEDWSTPSRDNRIASYFSSLGLLHQGCGAECPPFENYLKDIKFEYTPGNLIPLNLISELFKNGFPSSNPNDETSVRWSLEPSSFIERLRGLTQNLINLRNQDILTDKDISNFYFKFADISNVFITYQSNTNKNWSELAQELIQNVFVNIPFEGNTSLADVKMSSLRWSPYKTHTHEQKWGVWGEKGNETKRVSVKELIGARGIEVALKKSENEIQIKNIETLATNTLNALMVSPNLNYSVIKSTSGSELLVQNLKVKNTSPLKAMDLYFNENVHITFYGNLTFFVSNLSNTNLNSLCFITSTQIPCFNIGIELTALQSVFEDSDSSIMISNQRLFTFHKNWGWKSIHSNVQISNYGLGAKPINKEGDLQITSQGHVLDLKIGSLTPLQASNSQEVKIISLPLQLLSIVSANTPIGIYQYNINEDRQLTLKLRSQLKGQQLNYRNNSILISNEEGFDPSHANVYIYEIASDGTMKKSQTFAGRFFALPLDSQHVSLMTYGMNLIQTEIFDLKTWTIVKTIENTQIMKYHPDSQLYSKGQLLSQAFIFESSCLDKETWDLSDKHDHYFNATELPLKDLDPQWSYLINNVQNNSGLLVKFNCKP